MTINQAFEALVAKGADLEQVGEDQFLVRDNGFWGFAEPTDPFVVDGDDLLEMFEDYCEGS